MVVPAADGASPRVDVVRASRGLPAAAAIAVADAAPPAATSRAASRSPVNSGEFAAASRPQRTSSRSPCSGLATTAASPVPPASTAFAVGPSTLVTQAFSLPRSLAAAMADSIKVAPPLSVRVSSVVPYPPALAAASTRGVVISGIAAPAPPSLQVAPLQVTGPAATPPHQSTVGFCSPTLAPAAAALPPHKPAASVPASHHLPSSRVAVSAQHHARPSTTGSAPPSRPSAAGVPPLVAASSASASSLATTVVAAPESAAVAAIIPPAVATSSIEDAARAAAAAVLQSEALATAPSPRNTDGATASLSDLSSEPARAAVASMSRLTTGERVVSFLVRAIFTLSPPDIGASKVATPALLVAYFACRMAFLAGTVDGDDVVYDTMTAMFKSPVDGWKGLCGMFGVSERGLILSGSLKRHAQFVGQPPSVRTGLNNVINPDGKPQWLSRRISLRKSLYLYPSTSAQTPGALTSGELSDLRKHLDSPRCRSMSAFLGCKTMPGSDPDGNLVRIASVEFDWAHAWVPSSTPARLVDALKGWLLKPPNADLSRVTAYPRGQAATALPRVSVRTVHRTAATAASPVQAGKDAGGLSAPTDFSPASPASRDTPAVGPRRPAARSKDVELDADDQARVGSDKSSSRNPDRIASGAQAMGKRGRAWSVKPPRSKRGALRFQTAEPKRSVHAAPPPLMTGDEVVGCIGPSAVWPDGAWAIQVPLPPHLDALAVGRLQLDVSLECNSLSPDSNGEHDYVLVVTQEGNILNDLSRELGAFVTAAPGLDDTSRSLDFPRGVRRIAEIRRWESPASGSANARWALMEVASVPTLPRASLSIGIRCPRTGIYEVKTGRAPWRTMKLTGVLTLLTTTRTLFLPLLRATVAQRRFQRRSMMST